MEEQARTLAFVDRRHFVTRPLQQLTEELLGLAGPGIREVICTTSPAEAVETALRLVLHRSLAVDEPDRNVVLTQYPSVHEMTAREPALADRPHRGGGFAALHGHPVAAPPVTSADPARLLPGTADWDRAFAETGAHRIAAVLVETVSGVAGGASMMQKDVLRHVEGLCRRSGALLMVDETLTGLGRSGEWFDHLRAGIAPDLVVVGAGLTGGYHPLAACLAGDRVLLGRPADEALLDAGMGGNPLSAAVALATLRYIREVCPPSRVRRSGQLLRERLTAVSARYGFVGPPRGTGLLQGLPLRQDSAGFARAPLSEALQVAARENGLLVCRAGVDHRSQAVLITPPLSVTETDLDVLAERLDRALSAVWPAVPAG
jgi:adenosylmethionine-8-amino-7-oxononanoate aminotransferase